MKALILAASVAIPMGVTSSGEYTIVKPSILTQVKITGFHCEAREKKTMYLKIYGDGVLVYTGRITPFETAMGANFPAPLLIRNPRFHQDKGLDCDISVKLQDLPQQ